MNWLLCVKCVIYRVFVELTANLLETGHWWVPSLDGPRRGPSQFMNSFTMFWLKRSQPPRLLAELLSLVYSNRWVLYFLPQATSHGSAPFTAKMETTSTLWKGGISLCHIAFYFIGFLNLELTARQNYDEMVRYLLHLIWLFSLLCIQVPYLLCAS